MNYDAHKLPLGKLAKNTILNGFAALKVIFCHPTQLPGVGAECGPSVRQILSEVIGNPDCDAAKSLGSFRKAVEELTGRYYSYVL